MRPAFGVENGTEIFIPLNKLKKSPKNARKTPHSEAAIEAYAASIAAKGILQNLVVEPELDGEGAPTGCYFVTIGEGRRVAQLLRVKRKEIKKTEPIRCIVDTEISLDENVTRENMHPADQFEAFKKLAQERGLGAEEIAARFGVTPHVVRQRLRLAAVSPRLMQVHRDGGLTLEQLMAFVITENHARQEAVYERLSYNRDASTIRRLLTETHVAATDRRAVFVGVEAYTEAGGTILRDLFTEDRGGHFEDVALLDLPSPFSCCSVWLSPPSVSPATEASPACSASGRGLRRCHGTRPAPVSLVEEAGAIQEVAEARAFEAVFPPFDLGRRAPPRLPLEYRPIAFHEFTIEARVVGNDNHGVVHEREDGRVVDPLSCYHVIRDGASPLPARGRSH